MAADSAAVFHPPSVFRKEADDCLTVRQSVRRVALTVFLGSCLHGDKAPLALLQGLPDPEQDHLYSNMNAAGHICIPSTLCGLPN